MVNKMKTIFLALISLMFLGSGVGYAGDYADSAHGDTSTGVDRTTTTQYATGNCAHCHEQHASIGGSEPEPNTDVGTLADGPDIYLGFAVEQHLCLGCHGGTPDYSNSGTPHDINDDITATSKHNLATSDAAHRANETLAELDDTKHIECTDCHNPHEAIAGNHTAGTNAVSDALKGVSGVVPTFSSSNWTEPTAYNLQTATKEHEICFKCHSSANANLTTWDSSWTDAGLQFSSNNLSYHPVADDLTGDGSTPLDAAQMLAPWKVGTGTTSQGTKTMYCSDCHGDSANDTTAGPHGSSSPTILKNRWPENSSGYLWNLNDADSTKANAFDTECLCLNCHPIYPWQNEAHSSSEHSGLYKCVQCHVGLPHGSNLGRLIADRDLLHPYDYNDTGSGGYAEVTVFVKLDPGDDPLTAYTKWSCEADCASQH